MNIFKKILSFIILLTILNSSILNVAAISNVDYKSLILSQNSLEKTVKGRKYMNQIDELIDTYKDNREVLEKLDTKLSLLFEKLKDDTSSKNQEMKNIINYFYLKTIVALNELNKKDELSDDMIEKKLMDVFFDKELEEELNENQIVSEEEKEMIDEKLVEIQLNLLDGVENKLEKIIEEFEEYSNYTESGDFDMNFNFDNEDIGIFNASLNLNDYTSTTSNFDSRFSGKLDASYDANFDGEVTSLSISSILDLISKDGNIYMLLENLNISQENLDYYNEQIEKIKEIASENKYIKYSDNESTQMLNILKSLSLNNFVSQGEMILSQAMFEAYKKDGDKYYLQPTIYACSEAKKILNKFDPFYGSTCSQGQYEDMLEELSEVGEVYINIGSNNTTLGFEGIKNNELEKLEGYVVFSDTQIEEINFSVIPDQNRYPGEYLELEYIKNDKLNFVIYADEGNIDYSFKSELDNNNRFTVIIYTGKTVGWYDELVTEFILDNKEITGSFEIISSRYDYNTSSTYLDKAITGTISGNTNYSNKLSLLNIEYIGDDSDTGKYLDGKFSYDDGKFSFSNNTYEEGSKSNIKLNFDWDKNNKIITDGDLLLEVFTKQGEWDYDTWEYSYTGAFEKNFELDLDINNKVFEGNIDAYSNGEKIFNSNFSGEYDKKYFKMNNDFEILENEILYYFYGIEGVLKGNLNMLLDSENDKNNVNILFDTYLGEDQIIDFELNNKGTKVYGENIDIELPDESDVIDFEDVIY